MTQPHTSKADPGQGLGIAGFVIAFTGINILGLILSIVGLTKSRKAGYKNGLAVAGIVLNAVLMVVVFPLLIGITIVSYNGVTNKAYTTQAQAAARDVIRQAELEKAENGTYPTTNRFFSALATGPSPILLKEEPNYAGVLELYGCDGKGYIAGYWDYTERRVKYIYAGDVSSTDECQFLGR